MREIQEIKGYSVEGKLYETKEEAEREVGIKEIEDIIEKFYCEGISKEAIKDGLLENKERLSKAIGLICEIECKKCIEEEKRKEKELAKISARAEFLFETKVLGR